MSVVIKVENLSKRYRLGMINRKMLYEDLQRRWARFRGKADPFVSVDNRQPLRETTHEEIWALQDVNLEVRDGDVVGIIGRNGSGKSTLLKILSKITAPTKGRAMIRGRVASLLEVGTGFHGELTGRENVYMNGSILGMTKAEIDRKFDEIVEFSGVEKFIDTPVKRYSSGMMVRLAFAVAAHIEPEVLIIDEVLAVGDAAFQKKCLGKVSDVAREGRTILFVSHQAAAVENLCRRGIVLENGRVAFDGTQTEALGYYANSAGKLDGTLCDRTDRQGTGDIRVRAIEFRSPQGSKVNAVSAGQDVDVFLHFESVTLRPWPHLMVSLTVKNQFDIPVFIHGNLYSGDNFGSAISATGAFVCRLKRLPLPASSYRLDYLIRSQAHGAQVLDGMDGAAELHIEGGDFYGSGQVPSVHYGTCLVDGNWRLHAGKVPELARRHSVSV